MVADNGTERCWIDVQEKVDFLALYIMELESEADVFDMSGLRIEVCEE